MISFIFHFTALFLIKQAFALTTGCISACNPTCDCSSGDIEISPSVVNIDDYAFNEARGLTNVIFPTSVISIGEKAFAYNRLEAVTIPSSVTSLGEEAFSYNNINNLILPSSLSSIAPGAFRNNELLEVVVPDSVKSIGEYAFMNNKIRNLTISASVVNISDFSFAWNQLASVSIPCTTKIVGDYAFWSNQITSYVIENPNVTSIGYYSFSGQFDTLIIPASTTIIWEEEFSYFTIRELIIPSSVTTIEAFAFSSNQLQVVNIPSSVTSIGSQAFAGNPQLTKACFEGSAVDVAIDAFPGNTQILINCDQFTLPYVDMPTRILPAFACSNPTNAPITFPAEFLLSIPVQNSTSCLKSANLSGRIVSEITSIVVSSDLNVIVEGRFQSSNIASVLKSHLLKVRWFVGRSSYRQTLFLNSTDLSYPSNLNDMIQFRATFPNFFPVSADFSGYLRAKVILTNWPLRKKAICLRWKRKA